MITLTTFFNFNISGKKLKRDGDGRFHVSSWSHTVRWNCYQKHINWSSSADPETFEGWSSYNHINHLIDPWHLIKGLKKKLNAKAKKKGCEIIGKKIIIFQACQVGTVKSYYYLVPFN